MTVINDAHDASVFMRYLLQKLGLPAQCSHVQFVEAFSKLQAEATKYEQELKHVYLEAMRKQENNQEVDVSLQ